MERQKFMLTLLANKSMWHYLQSKYSYKVCRPMVLATIMFFVCGLAAQAQTTAFSDDFSANNSTTWTTSGAIGSTAWTVSRSGNDWGARRTSNRMELTNDASGTSNSNGWAFAYVGSGSLNCYSDVLSSNLGTVTWNFNMRQITTDPGGFTSNAYGVAFVLAGSSATAATAGSGYAVVLGQSNSTDPVRLVRYNNGLRGTLTNIITSNTSGLTDFGTNYLSVRVVYTPSTNTWQLLLRNDGTSAFADPAAGTMTSQGTATNNTHTGTSLGFTGAYWQGSTTANQTAFFDNVSIVLQTPVVPAQPSTITGTTTVCGGTSQTYSVTNVAGVTYTWALPSGWSGTSTTNSITVTTGSSSGTITVTPSTSCGNGTARTLAVTISGNTPTNSLCANATSLACGTSALAGSTNCTSNTAHGTGYSISNYGVWYTFQGEGGATTITTTAAAGFDHEMSILSGSCGGFTQIATRDVNGAGGTESYAFNTVSGTTYYVYVAYFTTGSTTGNFTISRTCNKISFVNGSHVSSDTICAGSNFTVYGSNIDNEICSYSGSNKYGYYWFYSADNGANWSFLPGITYTSDGMGNQVTVPQNSPTFGALPVGTYLISRDYYRNTCDYAYYESNYLTLTVISESTAPTTISGNSPICNGGSATLTASGGTAGDGATFQWYAGSCGGGTLLGTGASITVSPTVTTSYFVRRSGTCNTTTCVSASLTVNQLSTAPTTISGNSPICNGGSATLTASGGTAGDGATFQWYAGSCGGGTLLGTGASITVSPTTTTSYFVRRSGTCNTTTCVSASLTVNQLSTAPTTISGNAPICNGSSATLTASGGTAGDGATFQWYAGSCGGGTLLGTGASITVSPTTTTSYFVRRSGTCNTTTCISESLTVNGNFTAPAAISGTNTICLGESTTLSATGGVVEPGTTYQWYANSCGMGAVISTSSSITVSPTSTTTYFVRRTGLCITTACISTTVTVNQPSATPSVNFTLSNGDYLWSGKSSTSYTTAANWYVFDGTNYSVASTAPSNSNNAYIAQTQQCLANSNPSIATNNVSVRNVYIDTNAVLILSGTNNLNVSGNWTNRGTFTPNSSTITFNGTANQTIVSGMGSSSTPVAGKSFHNVIINKSPNTSQVILSDNLNVTEDMEITAGELYITSGKTATAEDVNIATNGKLRLAGELRVDD